MNKKSQDGGPAFPGSYPDPSHADYPNNPAPVGMSLRDWFAGMALQGICSTLLCSPSVTFQEVADRAYQQADAMLAFREEAKP